MVPLLLVGGLAVQYVLVYGRGHHRWQRLAKRQSITASSESLDRPPLEVCETQQARLQQIQSYQTRRIAAESAEEREGRLQLLHRLFCACTQSLDRSRSPIMQCIHLYTSSIYIIH